MNNLFRESIITIIVIICMCSMSCGPSQYEIDMKVKRIADSLYAHRKNAEIMKMKDWCNEAFDSMVMVRKDSILNLRLKQIKSKLEQDEEW